MAKCLVGMEIRCWISKGTLMAFDANKIAKGVQYIGTFILGILVPNYVSIEYLVDTNSILIGLSPYLTILFLGILLLFYKKTKPFGAALLISTLINSIFIFWIIYSLSQMNFG